MGGLDPGEKGGDEALSVLALLWVEAVDDQGCDVVLTEGEVRLPPRTWIPDDAIQLADLVIDAGHLLAPDMEVAEVDVRALPDQVVEDSPNARIPDALLFYTCHIKEQGRCRVGIATIDGVLVGMEMGNGALRICLHHVTSFQAL